MNACKMYKYTYVYLHQKLRINIYNFWLQDKINLVSDICIDITIYCILINIYISY